MGVRVCCHMGRCAGPVANWGEFRSVPAVMWKLGLGIRTGASTEDAVEKKKRGALRREMVREEGCQFLGVTESHGRILIRSCLWDRNILEFDNFLLSLSLLDNFSIREFSHLYKIPLHFSAESNQSTFLEV
jgi:hypothetical protein